jgi:hypothetical protein
MTAERIQERRAVLACFRREPEFDGFINISANGDQALLRWLDESGLALYLAQRFDDYGLYKEIHSGVRGALDERMEANRRRTSVLLSEFQRVNAAIQRAGVRYAVIKGFSLTPEFCCEPWLRHQSDIDLLVAPADAVGTIEALRSLGYELEPDDGSGELCLAIRSGHVPSAHDFIYDSPRNQHVEIHTSFYEPHCGVSLEVGEKWAEQIEWREVGGVRYPGVDLRHRFVMQVLHVFRHLASWARTAWLYEIAYFAERFRNEREVWCRIDGLLHDQKVRRACGVVCAMVANTFGIQFPAIVQETWIEPLPPRQAAWISRYGESWMLSDFLRASKAGLLLQREFADSSLAWWSYRAKRYRKALKALRRSENTGSRFLVERARKQMDYLWESLRWSKL